MKNGFGEADVACDTPEPCKFPSLDSCQKRFLWTHKGVDLAPHPVVKSCAPSRRCGEVPSGIWFRKHGPFIGVIKQGPCFTAIEDDGGDKRLVQLELVCEADGVELNCPLL